MPFHYFYFLLLFCVMPKFTNYNLTYTMNLTVLKIAAIFHPGGMEVAIIVVTDKLPRNLVVD